MKYIHIDKITIAEGRQRRIFDSRALAELKESIRQHGILHPPSIHVLPDGRNVLLAGERRFRAMAELIAEGERISYGGSPFGPGLIPVNKYSDPLELIQAEEIELDENLKRVDLTWQERSDAVARLHKLRIAQNPDHTLNETATEVRGSAEGWKRDQTKKDILVSQHLDNPEVAKAKSVDEAVKILKRQERQGKTLLAGLTHKAKDSDLQLFEGSCFDLLADWFASDDPQLKQGAGVILIDPPYGINAHKFGDNGGCAENLNHAYDDSPEAFQALMQRFAPISFQAAAPQAHLYCFCDIDNFPRLKALFALAGWTVFRTPLVVVKSGGRVPLPNLGPRRQTEFVLFANKGKRPQTAGPDWIISDRDKVLESDHGAKKSVGVYRDLLERSQLMPGDLVADFFCGSGPIFAAAHQLKLRAIGSELEPQAQAECRQLINKLLEG